MKVLAEKDSLPMFLATSEMIKETPILKSCPADNDEEVKSRLKEIEKSINSILDQNNRITSTSTLSTKEVSDESSTQEFSKGITWAEDDDINLSIHNSPSESENMVENDWINVMGKNKKNDGKKTWKERLNILRGTAVGDNEVPLSADVDLVAYGLSKDTTGVQLSQWLNRNGLVVRSCDLLTRFEGARSLTYKIVVKASDYDKAINPDIWPARVGVRKFKFFGGQYNKKGISKSKSQRNESPAFNRASNVNLKPILRNSNGNMLAHQSLQTVPGNLWLPANSRNYQNIHGLDESSRGNRKCFQDQMNAPVNGSLSQDIYQPRNDKRSNDLNRNTVVQNNEVNNSFGYQNNYQASNGKSPVVRFSENLGMDYYV